MARVRAVTFAGFRLSGDRASAMVKARIAARMAVSRQGNCRKASSGAWVQMMVVTGVRRRVMAMVRMLRGRRMFEGVRALTKCGGLSTSLRFGRDDASLLNSFDD